MAAGWKDLSLNEAAIGGLAKGARRHSNQLVKLAKFARGDDYIRLAKGSRAELIKAHCSDPGMEIVAALAYGLRLTAILQGRPGAAGGEWGELASLPSGKDELAALRHLEYNLKGIKALLSETGVAESLSVDRDMVSGDLPPPEAIPARWPETTIANLDQWVATLVTGVLKETFVPRQRVTLEEAAGYADGKPFAVYREEYCGFPTVVTGRDPVSGEIRGFPTSMFEPTDFYSLWRSWMETGAVPDAEKPIWTVAEAAPGVIDGSIIAFHERLLPTIAPEMEKARYVGIAKAARLLGVTTPRLTSWFKANGITSDYRGGWRPVKKLGEDIVVPDLDFMGKRIWRWNPAWLETLRPSVAQISQTPVVRVAKAPEKPSPAQARYIGMLTSKLGIETPEGALLSKKAASTAIKDLLLLKETGRAPAY